ncbi:tyrosine-type recombinase/integrase [Ancylobacter polymorphus]|uniref:Tyrosine-type recombinase/integrase n=1 Tax=Ancylobacter polymorphus TaxID=223390 RepID=A0A9E7A4A4_9HYPH|nr:site-specific integrase [Ancylobacter polymorphus]UOK70429.1 tyrosine-type recombinase/integrase [Ancylobacter polymorphus]
MPRHKLTESGIRTLTKPGVYGDGDGLWLRIQKGGSRNWIFIWRRGSERREIGLGGHGAGTAPVSLKLAREKANAIREALARGEDPRPRQPKKELTFAEAMEAVLELKAQESKNAKHKQQWEMTLREYAKPLHGMSVGAITVDDVVSCLTPHWTERPETADRLRSRIGIVLDYAKARGLRSGDNPAAWKGNLDKLLPKQKKLSRGHHAALDYHDVPTVIAALRSSSATSARALEFMILTAGRSSEVRGALWDEIDLDKSLWVIPANRMKAGVEHRVPLPARAVDILKERAAVRSGALVFEGEREGRPISDTALVKALRHAAPKKPATQHGFRSSFRDWAGDTTAYPREVCEAALAHTIQGVEAAYRRKDALEKRRALMNDWAAFCANEKE